MITCKKIGSDHWVVCLDGLVASTGRTLVIAMQRYCYAYEGMHSIFEHTIHTTGLPAEM